MKADDFAKLLHAVSVYLVITIKPVMGVDVEPGEVGGCVGALLGARDATGEVELLREVGDADGVAEIMPSYVHFVYPRLSVSDGASH